MAQNVIGVTEQPGQSTTTPLNVSPAPQVALPSRQKVLIFDDRHQGISVGGGALRPRGHFTIEAWVCSTKAGRQTIYAEGGALLYLEGGELRFETAPIEGAIASMGAGVISGSWYHVAVARAGSCPGETRLYVNGGQNDNRTAIPPVLTLSNTYLGGQPHVPDSYFQGKLLEVRVWRYARSQAEIEANRLYRLTGRELGLVRCWSFDEKFGTILHDKTTYRAMGAIGSDAVWEESDIPLKLKLDPHERLMRSTGLVDYGYWFSEMARQQNVVTDPTSRRGRIWA